MGDLQVNRRGFLKALASGIATVAVGAKLARGMPDLVDDELRYKATERFSYGWTDQRAVFASPDSDAAARYADLLGASIRETMDRKAAEVLHGMFG